jgi:hypothetical protein
MEMTSAFEKVKGFLLMCVIRERYNKMRREVAVK